MAETQAELVAVSQEVKKARSEINSDCNTDELRKQLADALEELEQKQAFVGSLIRKTHIIEDKYDQSMEEADALRNHKAQMDKKLAVKEKTITELSA